MFFYDTRSPQWVSVDRYARQSVLMQDPELVSIKNFSILVGVVILGVWLTLVLIDLERKR